MRWIVSIFVIIYQINGLSAATAKTDAGPTPPYDTRSSVSCEAPTVLEPRNHFNLLTSEQPPKPPCPISVPPDACPDTTVPLALHIRTDGLASLLEWEKYELNRQIFYFRALVTADDDLNVEVAKDATKYLAEGMKKSFDEDGASGFLTLEETLKFPISVENPAWKRLAALATAANWMQLIQEDHYDPPIFLVLAESPHSTRKLASFRPRVDPYMALFRLMLATPDPTMKESSLIADGISSLPRESQPQYKRLLIDWIENRGWRDSRTIEVCRSILHLEVRDSGIDLAPDEPRLPRIKAWLSQADEPPPAPRPPSRYDPAILGASSLVL